MHISYPEQSQALSELRCCLTYILYVAERKSAFTKPLKLSDELAAFVGQSEMSRPQVMLIVILYLLAYQVILEVFQRQCIWIRTLSSIEPTRSSKQENDIM